ncbi:MAG: DUF5665 domain-containing protein [Rhodobacterales bacterium]
MSEDQWHNDLASLKAEVHKMNSHRFIRMHNSLPKLIGFNFMRGLAFGLGSVLGATVLVSVLVYFLRNIDFIPILGDWAKEVLAIISDQTSQ